PTAGEVELDGRSITRAPPGKREVAMVFQSFALFPHLTVAGNLAFELGRLRLGRAAAGAPIREACRGRGLEDLLQRVPPPLAPPRARGGARPRRGPRARPLPRGPRLLLPAGPLPSLDAVLRREVRSEVLRLHRLHRSTTVLVTHDPADAMALATRVAVLRAGR